MRKETIIFLFVVLGLSMLVKLTILSDQRDFWHDEAFQVVYSEKPISFIIDSNDVHPPLYNLLAKFILLITKNIAWLRYTSIIFSLFFLERFFNLVNENFNKRIAMFSTTMIAFSFTYLYYATEFRNYSFVLMLVVFQIYYFNQQLRLGKGVLYYLLFSVLMVYSHYMSALIIITQLIYILIFEKYIPSYKKADILQSYVGLFALCVPLFIYLAKTIPKLQSFWFKDIDFVSLLSTFAYILAPPIENYHYGFGLFYIVLFGTMIYFRKKIDMKYVQFAMYLFVPVIIMWTISQVIPFYHHRYFLFGGIGFFVLVGWGVDKIAERFKEIDTFFLGMWIILVFFGFSTFVESFDHELFNGAYFLQNETMNESGVAIIHTSTFSQTPMKVYLPYAKHYLLTNLTREQLFTAGGSAVEDYEIIRNISEVDAENIYGISNKRLFRWTIYEGDGIYVTEN